MRLLILALSLSCTLGSNPFFESLCGRPDTFDCGDGTCVYNRMVCDGKNHCDNMADENQDCECNGGQFKCDNEGVRERLGAINAYFLLFLERLDHRCITGR